MGPFSPTAYHTDQFEVAVKKYSKGDTEARPVHRIAREFTVIVTGQVLMNGNKYGAGDIIEVSPGESADFQVLDDTMTVVVKAPAVLGDKYEV